MNKVCLLIIGVVFALSASAGSSRLSVAQQQNAEKPFTDPAKFSRNLISVLLCATSESSVPLWWKNQANIHHRDTENTEVAQRISN